MIHGSVEGNVCEWHAVEFPVYDREWGGGAQSAEEAEVVELVCVGFRELGRGGKGEPDFTRVEEYRGHKRVVHL